jgi:hypothetical protein
MEGLAGHATAVAVQSLLSARLAVHVSESKVRAEVQGDTDSHTLSPSLLCCVGKVAGIDPQMQYTNSAIPYL